MGLHPRIKENHSRLWKRGARHSTNFCPINRLRSQSGKPTPFSIWQIDYALNLSKKRGICRRTKCLNGGLNRTKDSQRRWDFILESTRNIHDSEKRAPHPTNFCSDQPTPFSIWQTDCALNWQIDYVLNLSKKRGICRRTKCPTCGLNRTKEYGRRWDFILESKRTIHDSGKGGTSLN